MSYSIPVFKAERDAGIAEQVRASASIAYAASLVQADLFSVPEKLLAKLKGSQHAKAAHNEVCLHYLKTILASAGWNNNDDVFERLEIWTARNSPEDTPFNLEHKCDQIIGHVTGNYVIDSDGNVIADDADFDNVPDLFHVVANSVLYKLWDKEELQERMDTLLAEIAKGNEWFVSMECYFRGFDYAMKDKDGATKVVARSDKTAFLTKHLRAYGGNGKFGDQKVGRLLRNITFSGKGLVRKPANPASVIFAQASESFRPLGEIVTDSKSLGYSHSTEQTTAANSNEGTDNMAIEIAEVQKQADALRAEVETLKAQLRDNDVKAVQAKLDEALAQYKTLTEARAADATKLAELETIKATVAEKDKLLAEKTESEKALSAQLAAIVAEKTKADRLSKLKAALKVSETDADGLKAVEVLNESLASLDQTSFEAYVQAQAKFTPAPLAPKSTPAPLPPQSTNAPAPNSGKAALETAEPVPAPTNAVASEDNGVEKLRTSIASMFLPAEPTK